MVLADPRGELLRRGAHVGEAALESLDVARIALDLLLRIAGQEVDELRLVDEREERGLVAG